VPSHQSGPQYKYDPQVQLVWVPKYRKAVLVGPMVLRVRDFVREFAMAWELTNVSGKWARGYAHRPEALPLSAHGAVFRRLEV